MISTTKKDQELGVPPKANTQFSYINSHSAAVRKQGQARAASEMEGGPMHQHAHTLSMNYILQREETKTPNHSKPSHLLSKDLRLE